MYGKTVFKEHVLLKYCLDRHKAQKMCDKPLDAFLPVVKFVLNLLVTKIMIKNLDDALFAIDDVIFINEASNNVIIIGS